MNRQVAVVLSLALLCGCGGGGSGSRNSNPIVPTTLSSPGSSHSAAQFTITVPSRSTQSRNPKYVSSNTQSLVVVLSTINGQPYTGASTAVNLVPSNPDCSGSPLTCSFSVFAVPGTDVFTISTYDTTQSSTSPTSPTGNLLSQGTISVTINANQTNVVTTPLVLDGIAASYTAAFSDQHVTGTQSTGYYIAGNRAVTMTVSAQDASGATIVGVGAQSVQVTSGSSAVSVTSAGTNTYTVQVASYTSSPVSFTMTSSGGATTNFPVNTAQELFTTLYATGKVVGYALLPTGPSAISNDTISGFCAPWGLAFDASWNLWINDFGCGIVYAYNGTTQIASDTISNSNAPYGLAFQSTGELWIMNCGGSCIGAGTGDAYGYVGTTQTTTLTAGINEPISVAFDSTGNMWVGNLGTNQVTAYSMTGAPTQIVADTIAVNKPTGLAFDSSGHLWITSCGANCGGAGAAKLEEWDVSAAPSMIASSTGLTQPEMIGFDYTGFLWIADHNGNALKQYSGTSPTGTTIPIAGARPAAVAFEP